MAAVGGHRRRWFVAPALTLLVVLSACSVGREDDDDPDRPSGAAPAPPVEGSLVRTTTTSEVAVVLDEIPRSMRDRVTASLLAEPVEFWQSRAKRQLVMTTYRLVFRDAFYGPNRFSLPLPPQELWDITLSGEPSRHRVDGHDVVGVPYEFSSILLSSKESPGLTEPGLRDVGGTRVERFVLPVDPELLLQRTGYACMDEAQYPFNSVDSEEADYFFDDSAVVEKSLAPENYHHTTQPDQSCVDAVHDHVGAVDVALRFERLAWDPAVADEYRYGEVTGAEPDLAVYRPDFEPSRTSYRYIHARGSESCEVEEESVGGTGWRRLLQFATADENVGEQDLEIGEVDYAVTTKPGELDRHRFFELSECHDHFHFRYYGQLGLEGAAGDVNAKQGFCLQSTNRVANRETSPLHQPYSDCGYQGVTPGWVDQYQAGLPNQWLDTTDLAPGTYTRTFTSNPEGLLCEGVLVDEEGEPIEAGAPFVWAETDLVSEDGEPVEAPLCELSDDWDVNNDDAIEDEIQPHGLGLINSECTRGQIGPLRNCGFAADPVTERCRPGAPSTAVLAIPSTAAPQVVRLTEYSHVLESPIPARYEDSYVPLTPGVSDQPAMLANVVLMPGQPQAVAFTCPGPRDGGEEEPGGRFSVYTAPVFPGDAAAGVTFGKD